MLNDTRLLYNGYRYLVSNQILLLTPTHSIGTLLEALHLTIIHLKYIERSNTHLWALPEKRVSQ